jgi:deoxycytidylate deaminase
VIKHVPLPPQHIVEAAVEESLYSPCRSKRGVVAFRGSHILARGYNYKSSLDPCNGSEVCKATCGRLAIHAEQQVLLQRGTDVAGCEMLHVKTVDGRIVPSGGPSCVECSKLMAVSGIAGMWLCHYDGWRWYPIDEFHELSVEAHLTESRP